MTAVAGRDARSQAIEDINTKDDDHDAQPSAWSYIGKIFIDKR